MRVFERSSVRGIKADAPVSPGAPAPLTGWCIQQRLGKSKFATISVFGEEKLKFYPSPEKNIFLRFFNETRPKNVFSH